jgi:hypothetical protein
MILILKRSWRPSLIHDPCGSLPRAASERRVFLGISKYSPAFRALSQDFSVVIFITKKQFCWLSKSEDQFFFKVCRYAAVAALDLGEMTLADPELCCESLLS